MFEDTVDAGVPVFQKALGAKVNNSNLCTEIVQVNGQIEGEPHQRTAVCCLASLNAAKMSKWIGTDIVRVLLRTLDNVIQRFIENAPDELANARWSASQERSVGIGLLGFHDMLQQNHIPFESAMAVGLNKSLFKFIHDEALAETIKLAEERGPCPDAAKSGAMIRNALRIAIAPNANSSIFVDASPSIETRSSNAYVHRTRAGTHLVKNVNLENYMISNGFEEARRERIWNSILEYDGSVQHLTQDFDEWTREVYKTAFEIDQAWVIQHAADRQEYIDQAQSVNLFMPPKSQRDYLLRVFFSAWKKGLKTLYYQRTATPSKAHKVSKKMERVPLSSILVEEDCIACQG
jgi:ribonucleoside-diphosphate reductase alpha chain